MQLRDLLRASDLPPVPDGIADIAIRGIAADSRKVEPGFLFAALPGLKADGASFMSAAAQHGAAAIVAGADAAVPDGLTIPVLRVPEPRRALAHLAAAFYGRQPGVAVAVTGTSGKTSVADFTRQIFAAVGHKAASVGTIGVVKPDGATYGSLTTPDPVSLHATLAGLADDGVTHLAFEASSHGLDQFRLDGVKIRAAGFTNLGRDHLDYHPTIEAYLAAKLRLFRELLKPGDPAVIHADDERSADVVAASKTRGLTVMTVGAKGDAIRLENIEAEGFLQRLTVRCDGTRYEIALPLLGTYQAANALVAAGLAIATGEAPPKVFAALETLRGVKGRLEIVGEKNGALAVIDYAHKPEALAAALDAVRPFASGKLISVFGCGGDRDRGKRPLMGAISVARADVTIITDDNPRSEDPAVIRAEILAAAPGALEIGDRAEAIKTAVGFLKPGDVLIVAGKGHETGQIIGDRVVHFSDHDCVEEALARH